MKVFLFIMLTVTVMNIAKAQEILPTLSQVEQCTEEQREIHEENIDTYVDVNEAEDFLKQQIKDCEQGK